MSGILWLASYPKSGNTWVRAFLHNALTRAATPFEINRLGGLSDSESLVSHYAKLDTRPPEQWSEADIMALRPRVQQAIATSGQGTVLCKTHNALMAHLGQPMIAMAATAGAVYIVRNPLDVVISNAHHLGAPVDQVIEALNTSRFIARPLPGSAGVFELMGSWSEHVASWTARPNPAIHVMRYEDMIAAPRTAFGKLAKFMGLQLGEAELDTALAHSSFDELKRQEERAGFNEATSHSRFFRAGRAGQWREQLSTAQVERIVAAHRALMARFGYVPEEFRK